MQAKALAREGGARIFGAVENNQQVLPLARSQKVLVVGKERR